MFLRNVCIIVPMYKQSYPRRLILSSAFKCSEFYYDLCKDNGTRNEGFRTSSRNVLYM